MVAGGEIKMEATGSHRPLSELMSHIFFFFFGLQAEEAASAKVLGPFRGRHCPRALLSQVAASSFSKAIPGKVFWTRVV